LKRFEVNRGESRRMRRCEEEIRGGDLGRRFEEIRGELRRVEEEDIGGGDPRRRSEEEIRGGDLGGRFEEI
jgi:hypothetical protein